MENSIERLRKNKVFLSTPMYGGKCSGICAQSLGQLYAMMEKLEIPLVHHTIYGESMVTRARSIAAEMFMRSDATHLLFVDADIGFQASNVLELLAWQTDDSPYDVIGGTYLKKMLRWDRIAKAVKDGMDDPDHGGPANLVNFMGDWAVTVFEGMTQEIINKKEPIEVREIGMGFTMIRRSTFQLFKDTYPEYAWEADLLPENSRMTFYFHSEIDKDSLRHLGEDSWFCLKIRQAGGKVWVCPWISLSHEGSFIWGGPFADRPRAS